MLFSCFIGVPGSLPKIEIANSNRFRVHATFFMTGPNMLVNSQVSRLLVLILCADSETISEAYLFWILHIFSVIVRIQHCLTKQIDITGFDSSNYTKQ